MNIYQYLKRRDVRTMVDPSCIETYCDKNNKTMTRDTRSYQKDGMCMFTPLA